MPAKAFRLWKKGKKVLKRLFRMGPSDQQVKNLGAILDNYFI